jgi:capsular exopolysaccharide synthesis family protein
MSRIQQILAKAERDGTARRLSGVDKVAVDETPASPSISQIETRGFATGLDDRPSDLRPVPTARRADRPHEDERTDIAELDDAAAAHLRVEPRMSVEAVLAPVLVAALDPLSSAAEEYRSLRSRIAQSENGHAIRVIQVTSPGAQDGKTVTSLNLALTMAQEFQRRVIVIDADLRQPRLHELLGLQPGPGLVDVLTGVASLEEALVEIPEYHLTVLRAGRAYERPAEMLGSGPMRRLIDTFRTQFDRIVVDSPPTSVADPGAIEPLADRLILVVRAGSTTKPAIAHAISTLGSSKLLGLVFNDSGVPQQAPYRARS